MDGSGFYGLSLFNEFHHCHEALKCRMNSFCDILNFFLWESATKYWHMTNKSRNIVNCNIERIANYADWHMHYYAGYDYLKIYIFFVCQGLNRKI